MGLDSPLHIILLLAIVLLIFGAKRLPEIGRSLGEGMRGFKDSLSGTNTQTLTPAPPPAAPVVTPVVVPEATAAPAAPAPADPAAPTPSAG
jgi:sec-independent protein translocase protein TatA